MSKAWDYHNNPEGTDIWITPKFILDALGEFDLDPCAAFPRPWDTAKKHYTIKDNGLIQPWQDRVWCNPPYNEIAIWMKKMAEHNNGIALTFSRTETRWFFDSVWNNAKGILFIKGRLKFYNSDGSLPKFTSGGPSCLIAYGEANAECLKNSVIEGKFVSL